MPVNDDARLQLLLGMEEGQLAGHLNRLVEEDCAFFKTHGRRHRVRFASDIEIAQIENVQRAPLNLTPDERLFAIIKSLDHQTCTRIYTINGAEFKPWEWSEIECLIAFEAVAPPQVRDAEADALRLLGKVLGDRHG
jgi:hypothetical protein